MRDRQVGVMTLSAAALWTVGVLLVLADWVTRVHVGEGGVLVGLFAATVSVREMIHHEHAATREQSRQQGFELGREYEHGIRSLR